MSSLSHLVRVLKKMTYGLCFHEYDCKRVFDTRNLCGVINFTLMPTSKTNIS